MRCDEMRLGPKRRLGSAAEIVGEKIHLKKKKSLLVSVLSAALMNTVDSLGFCIHPPGGGFARVAKTRQPEI